MNNRFLSQAGFLFQGPPMFGVGLPTAGTAAGFRPANVSSSFRVFSKVDPTTLAYRRQVNSQKFGKAR